MTVLISIDLDRGAVTGYQDRSSFDRERAQIESDDDALLRHLRETLGGDTRAIYAAYNTQSRRLSRLSDLHARLADHIRFENLQGL